METIKRSSPSYRAFESLLGITSLEDITSFHPRSKKKYNYPYLEQDTYFPCQYSQRTPKPILVLE